MARRSGHNAERGVESALEPGGERGGGAEPKGDAEREGGTERRGDGERRRAGKRTGRRWWKRKRAWALAVLAALPLIAWVALRSPLVEMVAISQIERAFGVEATAERMTLGADGVLRARGVRLDLPGLYGPEGELLQIDKAAIDLSVGRLLRGAPGVPVDSVALSGVRARLALDQRNRLNAGRLRFPEGGGPGGRLPAVRLSDVTIELGESDAQGYETLETLGVDARLRPAGDGRYEVSLEQDAVAGEELAERLRVSGSFDSRTKATDLTLRGLDFADWSRRKAPTAWRELWRTMDVRGRVDEVIFRYTDGEGVEAQVNLADVDLDLPLETNELAPNAGSGAGDSSDDGLLAMRGVSGRIEFGAERVEAELRGVVEELPADVRLELNGYGPDAPLRVEISSEPFELRGGRGLLRFAPEMAIKVYERFTKPTGKLAGRVVLERRERGGELIASGRVEISGGEARFQYFPYPIQDLSGAIEFDSQSVRIIDFAGVGPTGARLEAEGYVAPPGDGAEVSIDVSARGIPTDRVFVEALPAKRRDVFNAVFDETEYARLIEDGFVQTPAMKAEREARLAELSVELERAVAAGEAAEALAGEVARLDDLAALPVFELGGVADMDVYVRRPLGADTNYATTVDMRLAEAGLLIDRFPYPVVTHDLVLRIEPGRVLVRTPRLRGLTGGSGEISGEIAYEEDAEGYEPAIDVTADGVPVDRYLIQALPGERGAFEGAGGATHDRTELEDTVGAFADVSVRRLLTDLRIDGAVDVRALVLGREGAAARGLETAEGGELSYDIAVTFADVIAQPRDGATRVDRVGGDIHVTPGELRVQELVGEIGGAPWRAELFAELPNQEDGEAGTGVQLAPTRLAARLEAQRLDLTRPVEAYLAAVAPRRAAALEELRQEFRPRGLVDAVVTLDTAKPADEAWRVELLDAEMIGFEAWGGVTRFDQPTGEVVIVPGEAQLDGFGGPATFEFKPAGEIRVSGSVPLDDATAGGVTVNVLGGSLASEMTRAIAASVSPDAHEWMTSNRLDGAFEARVFRSWDGGGGPPETRATLQPSNLSLVQRGREIILPSVAGEIEVGATGGGVDLRAEDGPVRGRFVGEWRLPVFPGAGVGIEGRLSGEVDGLTEAMFAVLPPAVEPAVEALELEFGGRLRVDGAQLSLATAPSNSVGEPKAVYSSFSGDVAFERAELLLGTEVTVRGGMARVDASAPTALRSGEEPGAGSWSIALTANEASLLQGVEMTAATALVKNGARAGSALVPLLTASCYGGRVTATAAVRPMRSDEPRSSGVGPAASRFELNATAADVRFGELLNVWLSPEAQRAADDAPPVGLIDRGVLTGDLTLEGVVGDADSRLGRATVRVKPAPGSQATEILRLPGVVELVKLTNFRAPVASPIEFAYADAFIRGKTLHLRDVALETEHDEKQERPASLATRDAVSPNTVAVVGAGTVTWPELALDLRFTATMLGRRTLLEEILDTLRNEVVTARVGGTIAEPDVEFEQFPATRQLVDSILRGEPIEEPARPLSGAGGG